MRAWQLHDTRGPESLSLDEIPEPVPGPGEVRIAPVVMGLNRLDLWVSQGLPAPRSLPHILGADAAGTIDAVGPGVEDVSEGDEVIVNPSLSCGRCRNCLAGAILLCDAFGILGEHAPGTLAERIVLPARNVVARPASVPWEVAGSFALATGTAYRMLRRARLEAGETLLVVGVGGGVSSSAALLGVSFGARVFVTSTSGEKIAWAVERGAEAGFASDGPFSKELGAVAGEADVVVENVGPATWRESLRAVRRGGRVVVCGSTSGPKVELTVPVLFFKQLDILGSSMFGHGELDETLALVERGAVTPEVDSVFGFEELPAAMARLDHRDRIGKVALRI
jgi:zinc-binding alcohol dehydrogenase/oxidoreductase